MMDITIHTEAFDGPLDLLYSLIEKNEVDIYDIPIAEITDQYISYINNLPESDMDSMADFIVLAATLLEIKSRMLLPSLKNDDDVDEEDPRERLVQRLLEYKRFKEAAATLGDTLDNIGIMYYKERDYNAFDIQPHPVPVSELLRGVDLETLHGVFIEMLRRKEQSIDRVRVGYGAVYMDRYTIEQKIALIRSELTTEKTIRFTGLFDICAEKIEIIVTFLAVLELIKTGEITITQDSFFSGIRIERMIMYDTRKA